MWIIHCHGNAVDCGMMRDVLIHLSVNLRVNVLSFDYTGYGSCQKPRLVPIPTTRGASGASGSDDSTKYQYIPTQHPSEADIYADVEAAYDFLFTIRGVSSQNIVVYGHSIGCAAASHLLTVRQARGLILHSPLSSGLRVLYGKTDETPYLVRCLSPCDPFPVSKYVKRLNLLGKARNSILIMHGKQDDQIHESHARHIYSEITSISPPNVLPRSWVTPVSQTKEAPIPTIVSSDSKGPNQWGPVTGRSTAAAVGASKGGSPPPPPPQHSPLHPPPHSNSGLSPAATRSHSVVSTSSNMSTSTAIADVINLLNSATEPWFPPQASHNDIDLIYRREYFGRLRTFFAALTMDDATAYFIKTKAKEGQPVPLVRSGRRWFRPIPPTARNVLLSLASKYISLPLLAPSAIEKLTALGSFGEKRMITLHANGTPFLSSRPAIESNLPPSLRDHDFSSPLNSPNFLEWGKEAYWSVTDNPSPLIQATATTSDTLPPLLLSEHEKEDESDNPVTSEDAVPSS